MYRIHQILRLFRPLFGNTTTSGGAKHTQHNIDVYSKALSGTVIMAKAGVLKDGEDPKKMTNKDWRDKLPAERYNVMREHGTERPFTGLYNSHYENGIYHCAGCGEALFDSNAKFDSGSGWPSFYEGVKIDEEGKDNIHREVDSSFGMVRVEVRCKKCDAHLGHVFNDGPRPTGERYCINSLSLEFQAKE